MNSPRSSCVRFAIDCNFLREHKQAWQRYRIKDSQQGPQVWEIKWAVFWWKDRDDFPGRRHTLIVARNVLSGEMKYFVTNRVPGEDGVTSEWLLWAAFGHWPVEREVPFSSSSIGPATVQK